MRGAANEKVPAKIRYNHPGTPATLSPLENGRTKVKLHTPQRAITPGQAAIFYQDDKELHEAKKLIKMVDECQPGSKIRAH